MGFLGHLSVVLTALVLAGVSDMSLIVAITPGLCDLAIRYYRIYRQYKRNEVLRAHLEEIQKEYEELMKDGKDDS